MVQFGGVLQGFSGVSCHLSGQMTYFFEYFTTKPISLLDILNQIKAQKLCIDSESVAIAYLI